MKYQSNSYLSSTLYPPPLFNWESLILANSNILTRKRLEEMSVTKLIDFTMKIQEDMIFGQNKLFTEIHRKTEIDRIDRN